MGLRANVILPLGQPSKGQRARETPVPSGAPSLNLSSEELHTFFSELQGLVRAGVPLGPDLDLHAEPDSRRLRQLWSSLETRLSQGERLSEALRGLSPQISEATLALIRAGEESGELLRVLEIIAQGHRRRLGLERCLRLAVIYPLIVALTVLGLLVFFGAVIIPAYDRLSLQVHMVQSGTVNGEEPVAVLWLIRICLFLAEPWGLTLAAGLALLLIWLAFGGLGVRPWFERNVLHSLPFIAPLVHLGSLARWSHTVGHLLERRVTLDTALALAEGVLDFPRLRRESHRVRARVQQGLPLSAALLNQALLPQAAAGLLVGAENRGELPASLLRLADHFSGRLDHQVRKFQAWIEPLMILITGLLVLWLVVALYLPMFSLMTRGMMTGQL